MELERVTKHTPASAGKSSWHVLDADGKALGRLATSISMLLQGKHKADYSRHLPNGDFVIVINAARVGITGNKREQKRYYRHTGFIGHLREEPLSELLDRHPERVIERAVKGMLPRNRLGRRLLRRLKVYSGDAHPHQAQIHHGESKLRKGDSEATVRANSKPAAADSDEAPSAQQKPAGATRRRSTAGRTPSADSGPSDQASPARPRRRRTTGT